MPSISQVLLDSTQERRIDTDRRVFSVKSMWIALVSPRRFAGRRRTDRCAPILDKFDSTQLLLVTLLMCLSIADSVFTLNLIARGGSELNPLMNWLLNYSVWAFTTIKMLLTAIPALVLVAASNLMLFNRIRARSVLAALVGMYAGLILYEIGLLNL